jgi:hypothetical protein
LPLPPLGRGWCIACSDLHVDRWGGTSGSNPLSSSGESAANRTAADGHRAPMRRPPAPIREHRARNCAIIAMVGLKLSRVPGEAPGSFDVRRAWQPPRRAPHNHHPNLRRNRRDLRRNRRDLRRSHRGLPAQPPRPAGASNFVLPDAAWNRVPTQPSADSELGWGCAGSPHAACRRALNRRRTRPSRAKSVGRLACGRRACAGACQTSWSQIAVSVPV